MSACSASFCCPAATRASLSRPARYSHTGLTNSGCEAAKTNTWVSGSRPRVARSKVAALTPAFRASALTCCRNRCSSTSGAICDSDVSPVAEPAMSAITSTRAAKAFDIILDTVPLLWRRSRPEPPQQLLCRPAVHLQAVVSLKFSDLPARDGTHFPVHLADGVAQFLQ